MQFNSAVRKFLHLNTSVLTGVFVFGALFFGLSVEPAQALTVNPRLEYDADPGSTIHSTIQILNDERQTRTFYLRSENFNSEDEAGTPSFTTRQEDLATWIKTPDVITLGPGQAMNLPLEIAVPKNAEPGGHYAAVFFLSQPPSSDKSQSDVGIESRLGSLILLRVSGDFVQDASILEFNTTGGKKFFTGLPIQFYYRFQNTGDDHQKPLGDIVIKDIFGRTVKIIPANTNDGSVLPKSIRRFVSVWTERKGPLNQGAIMDMPETPKLKFWEAAKYEWHNFAFGRYTATLKVVYGTKQLKSDRAEMVFYIIPWQLLCILIPAGLILLVLLRYGIKYYNLYIVSRSQRGK